MSAAVPEGNTGAVDQILDGAGDQNFSPLRQGSDAGPDVDSDAPDVTAADFTLAGVQTGSNVDTQFR